MTNENEGNELAKLLDRMTPEQIARIDALAPPSSPVPPDRATRLEVLRRVVLVGIERLKRELAASNALPPTLL